MYTVTNFKTKKALKEAVSTGQEVEVFQPGIFTDVEDGPGAIEGPHYPEPHKWYASVKIKDSVIVKGSVR